MAVEEWLGVWRQLSMTAAGEIQPASPADQSTAVPRHLPADLGTLHGRQRELDQLSELMGLLGSGRTGPITVITGMAGVGKTMLALRWAHEIADHFPDGQLYLDMHPFRAGGPMNADQALVTLLHSLGVAQDEVPVDRASREARYRSLLAGKRVLVLLDHVPDAHQVRPLLPATSGCLTLITSRNRLSSLVAKEGAHRIELSPLAPEAARQVLVSVIGADRVRGHGADLNELANICGRLPLALRIAAVNLADNPHQEVAEYVRELRGDDRLAALAIIGDSGNGVQAAFDLSYNALAVEEQRIFRELATLPDAIFASDVISGRGTPDVRRVIHRLVAEHLVLPVSARRFTVPDLLRHYARRLKPDHGRVLLPQPVRATALP